VAGNLVACRGTISDGTETGTTVTTSITIENTAPEAPVISIIPIAPIAGEDDLLCNVDVASYDVDGDSVTYSFDWDVDGVSYGGTPTTATMSSTIAGTDTTAGETWTCTVTPNDGDEDGSSSSTSVVTEEPVEEECWSLDFDGTGDTVDFGSGIGDFGTGPVSILFWVNATDLVTNSASGVISKGVYGSANWYVRFDYREEVDSIRYLEFYIKDSSNVAQSVISTTDIIPVGSWVHVAVQRNASGMKIFINGELDSEEASTPVDSTGGGSLALGSYSTWWAPPDMYLDGFLHEVMYYERDLSQEEIQARMLGSFDPLLEADLTGYWRLDEGAGSTAYDSSGNGHDGTIDGATWVEDCPEAPEEPAASALSCLDILESGDSTGDGTYWIDPDGTGAFEAYCDMTTDGGGWTALFIMNETTYDYSTGGSSSDVVDNERWSYDGTASTTYINELDSGGEYSQPATWTMNFVEWQVGSPSQGMYSTTVATSFDSTIVLAMFSGTDVQAGHVDGGYKCLGTCLAVPGADYSATFEEFHFAFNQSRPSSAHECRFSTGINDDVGFNDAVLGLMCNYYEGSPLMAYRHLVADGFTLMGR
jgi:hypothetical protein